jgi:formylglycine-generating enzyme required for sulfatase activity
MSGVIETDLAVGDFIGAYQVRGVIGRGPCGVTYRVLSNALSKEFALRVIVMGESLSKELVDALEVEAALLGQLSHAHIDRPLEAGHWEGYWYCLKDYVHDGQGRSLNARAWAAQHGGLLSAYQLGEFAKQVLSALAAAAAYRDAQHQGLVHGRLKPENILIAQGALQDSGFEVRVSDFAPYSLLPQSLVVEAYSSLQQRQLEELRASASEDLRALMAAYRSYDYLAPELLYAGTASFASDIYALGALLYELACGFPPYGRTPALSSLRPDLGEVWEQLLTRCLQSYPELRYSDYEELLQDIESLLPSQSVEETAPVPISDEPLERYSITPPGMVYIPGGGAFIGSELCGEDAFPPHAFETKGFYMDRSPVTNAQFAQFVEATGYETEAERGEGAPIWVQGEWKVLSGIHWRSPHGASLPDDFARHPVTQISYADAEAYCAWKGGRLPTESEWEYAARGGWGDALYPTGPTISRQHANFAGDGTSAVGQFSANGYGLWDMAGNVWEWTSSWYTAYPGHSGTNPHFGEQYRVVRGGAWMYDAAHCKLSYRNANQPKRCYPTVGFRVVKDFPSNKID